jgi:hypothetical protein
MGFVMEEYLLFLKVSLAKETRDALLILMTSGAIRRDEDEDS